MKRRTSKFIYLLIICILILCGCNDNETNYSDLLKLEKESIESYIKRKNITVVTNIPSNWDSNTYYLSPSGLYFNLENPGSGDTIEQSDYVIPSFIRYTLSEDPDSLLNWSTMDSNENYNFYYEMNNNKSSAAFYEAVGLMKHNNSIANIIVSSKLDFSENKSVTPYLYHLRIQFSK